MGRLKEILESRAGKILNIYCTAGFPGPDDTGNVIRYLASGGADIIELGMPYSDPLADGPVIQESGSTALRAGMTMDKYFAEVKNARETVDTPIIFMGYFNSMLRFGPQEFISRCVDSGIDAVIIPDLPDSYFEMHYKKLFEDANLPFVYLITPQTSDNRIREIDNMSTSFIYAVSSASTTGTKGSIEQSEEYLDRIAKMDLRSPVLTGFNIRTSADFKRACKYTQGAIIGSAFIKAIEGADDLETSIHSFIKSIRE